MHLLLISSVAPDALANDLRQPYDDLKDGDEAGTSKEADYSA